MKVVELTVGDLRRVESKRLGIRKETDRGAEVSKGRSNSKHRPSAAARKQAELNGEGPNDSEVT
ncbi:MAG: hypothetical protein U0105_11970 [Candidatus Obscuribacterales bacterium]